MDKFRTRTIGVSIATILILASALAGGATHAAERGTWKAGVAQLAITPAKLMWMSGYGARDHRAEGTLHDLYAKALLIEDPTGRRIVLVTLDLVGVDRPTSQQICSRLENRFGLARPDIALNCSHTHCGPVVGTNLRSMLKVGNEDLRLIDEYTGWLIERVEACVAKAIADLAPARLSWGTGKCDFAVNRRTNKEAEVPRLRAEGKLQGPSDHDVPVLAIHGNDDRLRSVVFGYACHATVLSFYQWCGDWPGFAYREIEQRRPGAIALFWAGCGADQNPLPRRTVELAEQYGRTMADAVEQTLNGELKPIDGPLQTAYAEVSLDFQSVPTRTELTAAAASAAGAEALRAKHFLAQLEAGKPIAPNYPYPVQTWRLGDGPLWVLLGGEVVVDYVLRLKSELGPTTTWVAGYTNDVMGYIPSRRVLTEGGYEGATSMIYYGRPSPWAPMVEGTIVRTVRGLAGK